MSEKDIIKQAKIEDGQAALKEMSDEIMKLEAIKIMILSLAEFDNDLSKDSAFDGMGLILVDIHSNLLEIEERVRRALEIAIEA